MPIFAPSKVLRPLKDALFLILLYLFVPAFAATADVPADKDVTNTVYLIRSEEKVKPDGMLDEPVWQKAERVGNFKLRYPVDTGYALAPTEVMMAYDDEFLYVAAICYRTSPSAPYVAESLKRDFSFHKNDNFGVYLDPFNGEMNGFLFAVTPFGVQREGLVTNTDDVSTVWDNKWYSGAEIYTDYYVVEMAIPFNTLRYTAGNKVWRVNFLRNDLAANEHSTWMPVPRPHRLSSLAFAGKLLWETAPPKPGSNISVIPYIAVSGYQDQIMDKGKGHSDISFGGDVKVGLTPSLNLDITIKPDFSQADADQQVINLSRFDIGLPEQRQFFLENSDIFERYGFSRIRPFFSRRIGAMSPVLAGARVSGQPAEGWRSGVLMAQTDQTRYYSEATGNMAYLPGQNYLVAAAQRQIAGRSSLGLIAVNRQAIGLKAPDSLEFIVKEDYNRVVGLDFNLASDNNRWIGKTFVHSSFNPHQQGLAHATFLGYRTQLLFLAWNHEYVSENYKAETGFVPRKDYYRVEPFGSLSFYPGSKLVNRHGPNLRADVYLNGEGKLTDRYLSASYEVNFVSTAEIRSYVSDQYVLLRSNFNPTNSADTLLAAGTDYNWRSAGLRYNSDQRKAFSWSANAEGGGYYNGKLISMGGNIGWRFGHSVQLQLKASYNKIDLPGPFADAKYFLIGPRADFTFTDKIFLSTFVQYNNQQNNFGLNTRVQWRFKPVSDVFLVYTDQYTVHPGTDPQLFGAKYRALVLKLSYWINV